MRKLCTILFLLIPAISYGQPDNTIFSVSDTMTAADTGKVKLHVNALNFMRNTEYFTPMDPGQTLFGYQFQGHVSYQAYPNLRISAGFYAQKDFGNNQFTVLQPVFAVNYKANKWLLNFGQLDGTTNHRLIEPLFNIDYAITRRLENGFQAKYQSQKWWFDGWINWEQATYHGAHNQEQFTVGLSARYKLVNKKRFSLEIPLQNTLSHRGGQIDDTGQPIVSRMNSAAGLSAVFLMPERQFNRLRLEQYFISSNDFSPLITQPYKNGHGWLSTLAARFGHSEFMLNYWHGTEYQSGRGTLIYNSYSVFDLYQFERVRQLVFARWLYYRPVYKNFGIDMRIEPVYEVETAALQYSYSLYICYKASIGLGKIRMK